MAEKIKIHKEKQKRCLTKVKHLGRSAEVLKTVWQTVFNGGLSYVKTYDKKENAEAFYAKMVRRT